jgi:ribonuclease R
MKKKNRGAAGQGAKSTKSFKQGNESRTQGKSGKKERKEIKNARSLRDVLGGGGRPASPSVGARGSSYGGSAPRPSVETGAGKKPVSNKLQYIMTFTPPGASSGGAAEQRPESSKAKSARPAPIKTAESKAVKAKGAKGGAGKAGAAKPTHHRMPARGERAAPGGRAPSTRAAAHSAAPSELHRRADFAWPKERIQEPSAEVLPPRARGSQRRIQGVIKRHPDGFGFLIPDKADHPDVYIARQFMAGVMTNDRVEAEVFQARGRESDRLFGEITRVVTRAHKQVVGKYLPVDRKYGVILDDGRGWGADLRIAAKDAMNAQEGDLVAVEVLQYPGPDQEFIGRVVGLLGRSEDPLNDVRRVIYGQGIPHDFSEQAIGEARRFGGVVTEAEMKGREDLRHLDLITIDGATARDFDDAIYTEQTARGFRLVVAIADVSHYVKPATHLDEGAYERGTSTYFPNFVVPMLPEELSNELCSLKPHVARLCFACEMQINFNGEIENYRFFEGVMESKARVIYGEAQEVIDGSCPPKLRHVEQNIRRSADLAKILMQKRFREGSLDLEIPETQVVVDSLGETVDIIKAERLFAHRLIEELMLVTNICTARFFDHEGLAGIYRIHEEPKEENIQTLQRFLWNFGGNRSVLSGSGQGGLQKKLTKALQAMEGKPGAQVLNILTLRSMNQAQYSPENVGHFGLGFSHYAHFTSPIRRYPDLIAHRLIKSRLYPRYRSMEMNEDELSSASTHLSACEQRSAKAERQVISIKKARFATRLIGEELEGMISSVAKFGVFVLLRQYDVDGLVKVESLGDDRFIFDEENLRLYGKRTGLQFAIGDVITVRVVSTDPEQGRIEFELAEGGAQRSKRGARGADSLEGEMGDEMGDELTREMKRGEAQGRKKGRIDVQERRKAKNDRRRVREKRVSKRRRKD